MSIENKCVYKRKNTRSAHRALTILNWRPTNYFRAINEASSPLVLIKLNVLLVRFIIIIVIRVLERAKKKTEKKTLTKTKTKSKAFKFEKRGQRTQRKRIMETISASKFRRFEEEHFRFSGQIQW